MFKLQYRISDNCWMDAILEFGDKVERAVYANYASAKEAQRRHEAKHRGLKYRVMPVA